MSVKETLRLEQFESSYAFRLFLTMILMFVINIGMVSADDDESAWNTLNERGAIELVVEDGVDVNSTIGLANELANNNDIEQAQTAEIETEPLTITIPGPVNVRSISNSNFGETDSTLPFSRNNVEVVGWFDSDNTPFDALASGTWLILEGGEHAVFASLVNETDGSSVTDTEAATTTEFEFNGSEFVPVIEVAPTEAPNDDEVEPEPAPEPEDDDADPEVIETPEGAESLSFPELPESRTITYPDPNTGYLGDTITETIEFNLDNRLPVELGLVEEGTHPLIDSIAQYETRGDGTNEEDWARIPVSGEILSIDSDPQYPDDRKSITVLTVDSEGQDIIVILDIMPFTHLYPVNDNLELTIPQADADLIYHISRVISEDQINSIRTVTPGDQIIFDMVNVPQGEGGNTVFSSPWRANTRVNGVLDGTPTAVFEAAASGEIDLDIPVVNAWGGNYIIFNHNE